MAKADLPALTGLRGVAALWVAAYHLLLPGALIGGLAAPIVGHGYLAVDLFFVLSGFVLALNYGADFAPIRKLAPLPGFLWRRWGRVFPLYGLILLTRLGYTACIYGTFNLPRAWIAVPSTQPWTDIPANLLLVQSWHLAPSLIGPAWSVSTEWAAYWAFPMLAAIMLHGRPRLAVAGAAGACLLVLTSASHGSLDAWDGRSWGPLLRCLGGFALGMGLWRLSRWQPAARLAASPAAIWAVALTFLLGCARLWPDLALYPLLPALVLCLACGQGGPRKLAGSRPDRVAGQGILRALSAAHFSAAPAGPGARGGKPGAAAARRRRAGRDPAADAAAGRRGPRAQLGGAPGTRLGGGTQLGKEGQGLCPWTPSRASVLRTTGPEAPDPHLLKEGEEGHARRSQPSGCMPLLAFLH